MLFVFVFYILIIELSFLLEKAVNGCVINILFYMYYFVKVKDLDFGFENNYNLGLVYNNFKLYIIWMICYFVREFFLRGLNIIINVYYFGLILINLGNDFSDEKMKKFFFGCLMKLFFKNLDEGIEIGYYFILLEEVIGLIGYYFDEKKVKFVFEKGYIFEKV